MQVREPRRVGGRFDTLTGCFVGPCTEWAVWYVGVKQYEILFNPRTQHSLIYSAEGAGKTVTMAMWIWLQIIAAAASGVTGAIGATAPTAKRLGTLQRAVTDLAPISSSRDPLSEGAWGTLFADAGEIQTCSGHLIQFRATKRQSGAVGSPVQGYTWHLGAAVDEAQDQVGAMPDIIARTRGGATPPIFATATAKDSPDWRTYRDSLNSDYWTVYRIRYTDAWAIHPSFWEMFRANCSAREWQRRGLALDVGPENMVFTSWSREHNLTPIPQVPRVRDVTSHVLARHGRNIQMLIGHDPGTLQDVSVMLKAYQLPGQERHVWWIVDELRTKQTTSQEHATALMAHLRNKWGLNYAGADEPKVLIRCDPYGDTDTKTDKSVYLTFRQTGFDMRSAAFKQGKGSGRIPKEAGIEMCNTLFCNAAGERRLFVATNDRGEPAAPLMVEAIELSERDGDGKAETQKKNRKGPGGDLSDFPAALRYALWLEERVRNHVGLTVGDAYA